MQGLVQDLAEGGQGRGLAARRRRRRLGQRPQHSLGPLQAAAAAAAGPLLLVRQPRQGRGQERDGRGGRAAGGLGAERRGGDGGGAGGAAAAAAGERPRVDQLDEEAARLGRLMTRGPGCRVCVCVGGGGDGAYVEFILWEGRGGWWCGQRRKEEEEATESRKARLLVAI